jgi:glycosyltransferase involved in cell wall biosynthesis
LSRPCILHLRASNFVGGPEHQLLRYAEVERGGPFRICLGTFVRSAEESPFLKAASARGLEILALPFRNVGPHSALPALIRELRSRKIDLLCTHGYKADIFGLLAGRLTGVPVACFLRGWTRENRRIRIYESLDRLVLPLARQIVCLSENQAQRLRRRRKLASRVRIVPNAIDLPDLGSEQVASARHQVRHLFGFPLDCPLIASAGRLSPEKGVTVFLDAAALLLDRYPEARFLVFGEGSLRRELESRSKQLGLEGRLRFAGFVPHLRELLPGLDVLVNPSFSEEMPNIVLEAMAAGIPTVATAVGGVPDIAGVDKAVSLVPPGSPQSIAEAVSAILANPLEARQLAGRGRSRVQQAYSLDRQKAQLHALYRGFLSGDRITTSSNAEIERPQAFSVTTREPR